jgi:hypothetical protein
MGRPYKPEGDIGEGRDINCRSGRNTYGDLITWCLECLGYILTSNVLQHYMMMHDIVRVLVTNSIRTFPSERRITWLRRHCNLARVLFCIIFLVPPGTYT